jgi:hypothetical protein
VVVIRPFDIFNAFSTVPASLRGLGVIDIIGQYLSIVRTGEKLIDLMRTPGESKAFLGVSFKSNRLILKFLISIS